MAALKEPNAAGYEGDPNDALKELGIDALRKLAEEAHAVQSRGAGDPGPGKDESDDTGKRFDEVPPNEGGQTKTDAVFDSIKPPIFVVPGALDAIADEAMRLLVAGGCNIFQRGNKLVRPVTSNGVDSRGRPVKFSVLMEVDRSFLRKELCRYIDWLKPSKDPKGRAFSIDPPESVALLILSSAGHWPFRTIAGIISTPTLRYDGSILDQPGYDPQTSMYSKARSSCHVYRRAQPRVTPMQL